MWNWYDLLPKDTFINLTIASLQGIGFASIKATQLGDRLLAASFITSAAANLGVTLFIGTVISSTILSVC